MLTGGTVVLQYLQELKRRHTWDIHKVMVAADTTEAHERCTKRLAQTVKKNAKFLSSRAATVRYIAENAFQSAKTKAVKSNSPRLRRF